MMMSKVAKIVSKITIFSSFVLFGAVTVAADLLDSKSRTEIFISGNYEYKLTHKKIGAGESGVLEVTDTKTKAVFYHEEGLPFKKVCNGFENNFSDHIATLQHSDEEYKEKYLIFCATNENKYSVLSLFESGQLVVKIQTVKSPLLIKKTESGVMYFKIHHKYPLIGGNEGSFYEIIKFDPWGVNSFRFMSTYDDVAIQEYKKVYVEMANAVKTNVDFRRFYLDPMLSALVSIGDTNNTCNEIKNGALSFATTEQINSALVSNSEKGYPYFAITSCTKSLIQ